MGKSGHPYQQRWYSQRQVLQGNDRRRIRFDPGGESLVFGGLWLGDDEVYIDD